MNMVFKRVFLKAPHACPRCGDVVAANQIFVPYVAGHMSPPQCSGCILIALFRATIKNDEWFGDDHDSALD